MKSDITSMKLLRYIKHVRIVPRWIIFSLDIFVSAVAFTVAYFLFHNFDIHAVDIKDFNLQFFLCIAATAISFTIFKLYSGIVRYTSAVDSIRILSTIVFTIILLFAIKIIGIVLKLERLIDTRLIITYALFLFALLILYRTTIKIFFQYSKSITKLRKNILVYGAGELGIAVKRTFDHDITSNKIIIGYVDEDSNKIGKSIDGIKILNANNIKTILLRYAVDELIIAIPTISPEKKAEIIDFCLEHDISTYTLPPVNKIMGGDLSIKQIKNVKIEDLLERAPIKTNNESIQNELKGKRVLVTGAAGSIGSEIAKQIALYGPQLIILCDQAESPLHNLNLDLQENNKDLIFKSFIGDVKNEKRMRYLFETFKPHIVYHAAAYKHVPMMEKHPIESVSTNVFGTYNLANLSVEFNVKKFVFVSTDKAVNPTNVMGASKRIAEIYVQALNNQINHFNNKNSTRFITTRFGNVLGSNGSVIPRFKEQIEKGGPVTVTHPEITRYFMTIPEACQLVLEAGCMGQGGEIYVFDMGKSVKIVNLAEKMIKLSGYIPYKEIDIKFTGLRPGEKLYEELLNDLENTLPTHNKKILIAKVRDNNFELVSIAIDKLFQVLKTHHTSNIVREMKKIVPEFISQNSEYEQLDEAPTEQKL